MKVFLTSDWHYDMIKLNKLKYHIDNAVPRKSDSVVAVLAGDICSVHNKRAKPIFEEVASRFKHTIFVPGNHDFWGGSIADAKEAFKSLNKIENFDVLYNKRLTLGNKTFLGTTMWFNYRETNDYINQRSHDYNYIEGFTPSVMYDECDEAMEFLERYTNQYTTVITHHAPHEIAMTWADPEIRLGFYCDYAEDIIDAYKPPMWMFGHTHMQASYNVEKTRCVSNPMGFGKFRNMQYNKNQVFEV